MAASLESLAWLLVCLALFLFVQRRLHFELQAVLLLLTRRQELAVGIFSLLFFPGVLLHELSHYLMARLLGVKAVKFSLLPKMLSGGRLRLGYVETRQTDIVRDSLIGLAPLLTGGALVAWLAIAKLSLPELAGLAAAGQWQAFLDALHQLPLLPDFWLWFYLAFTVSSTMLPSASDRQSWLPILLISAGLLGMVLLAGAGPWMEQHLAPSLYSLLSSLALIFGASLLVHLVLWLPVLALRLLLSRLTGLQVKP